MTILEMCKVLIYITDHFKKEDISLNSVVWSKEAEQAALSTISDEDADALRKEAIAFWSKRDSWEANTFVRLLTCDKRLAINTGDSYGFHGPARMFKRLILIMKSFGRKVDAANERIANGTGLAASFKVGNQVELDLTVEKIESFYYDGSYVYKFIGKSEACPNTTFKVNESIACKNLTLKDFEYDKVDRNCERNLFSQLKSGDKVSITGKVKNIYEVKREVNINYTNVTGFEPVKSDLDIEVDRLKEKLRSTVPNAPELDEMIYKLIDAPLKYGFIGYSFVNHIRKNKCYLNTYPKLEEFYYDDLIGFYSMINKAQYASGKQKSELKDL